MEDMEVKEGIQEIPEEFVNVEVTEPEETALSQFKQGLGFQPLPQMAGTIVSSALISGAGYIVTHGLIVGARNVFRFTRRKAEDLRIYLRLRKEQKQEQKKAQNETNEEQSN